MVNNNRKWTQLIQCVNNVYKYVYGYVLDFTRGNGFRFEQFGQFFVNSRVARLKIPQK